MCLICEILKDEGLMPEPQEMQLGVCNVCGVLILARPVFMGLHKRYHERKGEHPTDSLLDLIELIERDDNGHE